MASAIPTPGPTPTIRGLPRPLARAMEAYADRLDVDKIREAYDLAVEAHSGQRRASGEEYVSHTVEVATILATLRLDSASIIAGLIHDTVEDTALSVSELETRFGEEVSTIVDGVTKLGKVQFSSATEQQVENYRKMLLSMAEDARVILVKLADRLHNMRTLEHLPTSKQARIATKGTGAADPGVATALGGGSGGGGDPGRGRRASQAPLVHPQQDGAPEQAL